MRAFTFVIFLQLTVACFLLAPPVGSFAAAESADDGWAAEALSAAREQLTDLLASEAIDRLDFRARTFEEAIGLISTTAGVALEGSRDEFATAEEAARYMKRVTIAFDTHKPRGLGLTFPSVVEHAISDGETATRLGELLGGSTVMVRQYVGPDASPERITEVGINFFRHIVLEPMDGRSYLEQYLDGVASIAAYPPARRLPFLEK